MTEPTRDTYKFLTGAELTEAYRANEVAIDHADGGSFAGGGPQAADEYRRRRRLIVHECNQRKLQPWLQ